MAGTSAPSQATPASVTARFTGKQLLHLTQALVDQGHYGEALQTVRQGVDHDAVALDALPAVLQLALDADLPDALTAINLMREIMEKADLVPPDLEVSYCRALVYAARLAAAEATLRDQLLREAEGLLKGRADAEACYLLALVQLGLGSPLQELAAAVKACLAASGGSHGGAWLLLASLCSQQDHRLQAFSAIEGGLQSVPPAWKPHLWTAKARLEAAADDLVAAQHSVRQAIGTAATSSDAATSWAFMGRLLLADNQLAEAKSCVVQVAKLVLPDKHGIVLPAAILKAMLALHEGRHHDAIAVLDMALAAHADDPEILALLGCIHADAGKSQHHLLLAYVNLTQAVALIPSDAEAWHVLGLVCTQLGHDTEGRKFQARALRASRLPMLVDFTKLPLNII